MRIAILLVLTVIAMLATAPANTVTYFDSARVEAAFAKGDVLVNVGDYQVHASRRENPGLAEIHTRDTDIMYVLSGEATLVTGGSAVETKTVAQDEIRGSSIRNGETRRIRKGDVLVIPNGTPHWFKEVTPGMTYYVVKVRK